MLQASSEGANINLTVERALIIIVHTVPVAPFEVAEIH